jgi:nitrate/nitrite-specific signal transduction histidine kinase
MQIRNKFLLGLVLITGVVALSTGLIVHSFGKISAQRAIAAQAGELSMAALDFSVQNFHSQLEVWEYAYDPNEERLETFRDAEKAFDATFAALVEKAAASGAPLSAGARPTLQLLRQQVPALEATWAGIIAKIQSDGPMEARAVVIAGENTFDAFRFDDHVDEFIDQQKQFVAERERKLTTLIRSELSLVVLLSAVMLVSFGLFYWSFSKHVLVPIAQFTRVADAISRGDTIQPPHIARNDEVGALSEAFVRMAMAVRFLADEVKLARKEA